MHKLRVSHFVCKIKLHTSISRNFILDIFRFVHVTVDFVARRREKYRFSKSDAMPTFKH